jgi:hypothetical protein
VFRCNCPPPFPEYLRCSSSDTHAVKQSMTLSGPSSQRVTGRPKDPHQKCNQQHTPDDPHDHFGTIFTFGCRCHV